MLEWISYNWIWGLLVLVAAGFCALSIYAAIAKPETAGFSVLVVTVMFSLGLWYSFSLGRMAGQSDVRKEWTAELRSR